MRRILFLTLAAVVLVGCDRVESTIRQWRGEAPMRRPGLWQATVTRNYSPGPVVFLDCFDRDADAKNPLFSKDRSAMCDQWLRSRRPDGAYLGAERRKGETSGFTLAGDYDSRFTFDLWRRLSRDEGRLRAGTVIRRRYAWVYQGVCPSNIRPGQELRPGDGVVPIGAEVLH